MSTTIGIGYTPKNNVDLYEDLKELACRYGYGLLNGIECAELDMRSGLEGAQKCEGWEHVLFLQSPRDCEVALAFGIHEELSAYETMGKRPPFFEFLAQLVARYAGGCKKLSFFFSGEWYENDRVRYSYGSVEALLSLLSMPGYWGIRYLIPETGILQDSDEIPLVFDLILK